MVAPDASLLPSGSDRLALVVPQEQGFGTGLRFRIRGNVTSSDEPPASLDPPDWNTLRTLAHRMVDDALDRLRDIGTEPAWRATRDSVDAVLEGTRA